MAAVINAIKAFNRIHMIMPTTKAIPIVMTTSG